MIIILFLRTTHPIWRELFVHTQYPEVSSLTSHFLRAPIFCQEVSPTPVQVTSPVSIFGVQGLEVSRIQAVLACGQRFHIPPYTEDSWTSCLSSGLALVLKFLPILQNWKVRPASQNDPIIQSQLCLCFLTFELCWVSRDLGLGVPTTCTFSDHFSFPPWICQVSFSYMTTFWSHRLACLKAPCVVTCWYICNQGYLQRDPEKQMLSQFATASYFPKHGAYAVLLAAVIDIWPPR